MILLFAAAFAAFAFLRFAFFLYVGMVLIAR